MSDVTETLQDLMERRLNELGKRRGRGESISLREAYQRLLDSYNEESARLAADGEPDDRPAPPTYEVFRRIRNGHTRITDPTASALATMLEVDIDLVYAAAKIRPRLGRFELPTRADRLDDKQRQVVLDVVDAILSAAGPAETKPAKSGRRIAGQAESLDARRQRLIDQGQPQTQAAYEGDAPGTTGE